MTEVPTVFLVDDEVSVLKAIRRLLESVGLSVKPFNSAQEFLDSGDMDRAGCLVLDLAMPGMTGLALQGALVERASALPIIFLTGHGSIDTGVQAIKLGAADFLTKPVDVDKLLDAVRAAFATNTASREERSIRADILQRFAFLTPREQEVMGLVVQGKLNKQIAGELGAAEKTIKAHRAQVMTKMNVRSVAALVRLVDRVA